VVLIAVMDCRSYPPRVRLREWEFGVMAKLSRTPVINDFYEQYLRGQDQAAFAKQVAGHYEIPTLERLAASGERMSRRASVFALGLLADYESNAVVGRALNDNDRGVRTLADHAIRAMWLRCGSPTERKKLAQIVKLNAAQRHEEAIQHSNQLIERAPWLAEVWNQRAVAFYSTGRYHESINDCVQALELNPYHFGAAAGMGQCHLQLGDRPAALETFRRALRLNPGLEGVRAQVVYLQRTLKEQQ
jgi:tetratricopeptide (TPR) repeat protein